MSWLLQGRLMIMDIFCSSTKLIQKHTERNNKAKLFFKLKITNAI